MHKYNIIFDTNSAKEPDKEDEKTAAKKKSKKRYYQLVTIMKYYHGQKKIFINDSSRWRIDDYSTQRIG